MSSKARAGARRIAIVGTAAALGVTLAAATQGSAAQADSGRNILIADAHFMPADIGIFPGTTVVWTNTDEEPHNVASTDGPRKFGTGEHPLRNGQSFRFTFTKRGVYHFVSTLNAHAAGSITVGDRAFTAPPADEQPEPVPHVLPSATPSPLLPRDRPTPRPFLPHPNRGPLPR